MPAAGQIVKALDFAGSANVFESTNIAGATATTWAAGSPVCGLVFTAPTSGAVNVHWTARIRTNTATVTALASIEVREGSVIGSGTVFSAANDIRALEIGPASGSRLQGGMHQALSGLTPGASYNVRMMHQVSAAGNMDIFARRITIEPVI